MSKEIINLSWGDVDERAYKVAADIVEDVDKLTRRVILYGIPRGGVYAVQAVSKALSSRGQIHGITTESESADYFIDDIIDTGKTEDHWEGVGGDLQTMIPFMALVDYKRKDASLKGKWTSFPWERMINDDGPVENIRRLIEFIGDDPDREGLKDTPTRVIKSYEKLYGGYKQEVVEGDTIKIFEDDSCDEMVLMKNIEFYSTCEHHMLPFFGKAHIAYIPKGKVIGISKLARLLEIFARRLQIQERLCQQVTTVLEEHLQPLGAACILEAQHFCMTSRGVEKQHSIMVTSSLTGVFKEKSEARSELFNMIGK